MTVNCRILNLMLAAGLAAATATAGVPPQLTASFVQLTRAVATNSVAEWQADFQRLKEAGIDTVIVQWAAELPVAYFRADTNDLPACNETYPTLETFFEAVKGSGLAVHLGLTSDPAYWKAITARDRLLRDYFLLRVARNEKLQKQLLERFGDRPEWVGYYIPDEIDDVTWRTSARGAYLRDYLALLTQRLRTNDAARTVAVSAFFRGRTAPDIFARAMLNLTTNTASRVDALLVQDGAGVGDPPVPYMPAYFKALSELWPADAPRLWGVVELFAQTSKGAEPFAAAPADPARVAGQIAAVASYVERLVAFTFKDYADPARGPAAAALYRSLRVPAAGAAGMPAAKVTP